METIHQLIARRNIRMRATRVDSNPHMDNTRDMDHWRCTLRNDAGRRIQVFFSMGSAHNGKEPVCADVLDCLASDAAGSNEMFESWCSDLGYDSDSRRAYKTYEACRSIAARLKRLMGADYDALLYKTERL